MAKRTPKFPLVISAKGLYDAYLKKGHESYNYLIQILDKKVEEGIIKMGKIEDGKPHRLLGYIISKDELEELKELVGTGIPKKHVLKLCELSDRLKSVLRKFNYKEFDLFNVLRALYTWSHIELEEVSWHAKLIDKKFFINDEKLESIRFYIDQYFSAEPLDFAGFHLSMIEEPVEWTPEMTEDLITIYRIIQNNGLNCSMQDITYAMNLATGLCLSRSQVYSQYCKQFHGDTYIPVATFYSDYISKYEKMTRDLREYKFKELARNNLEWIKLHEWPRVNARCYKVSELQKLLEKTSFIHLKLDEYDLDILERMREDLIEDWEFEDAERWVQENEEPDHLEAFAIVNHIVKSLLLRRKSMIRMIPSKKYLINNLREDNFCTNDYLYTFSPKGNLIWDPSHYLNLNDVLKSFKNAKERKKAIEVLYKKKELRNEIKVSLYGELGPHTFRNYISKSAVEKLKNALAPKQRKQHNSQPVLTEDIATSAFPEIETPTERETLFSFIKSILQKKNKSLNSEDLIKFC